MEARIYQIKDPQDGTVRFFFHSVPELQVPNSAGRTVIVPDGSAFVKAEGLSVNLATPDGELHTAEQVNAYAAERVPGFALKDPPAEMHEHRLPSGSQ